MFGKNKLVDADRRSFKETTANMTGKQKWDYFWEYYKFHVFGTITLVGMAVWFIHSLLTGTKVYLDFAFVHGFAYIVEQSEAWDAGEEFLRETPRGIWFTDDLRFELSSLLIDESLQDQYMIVNQSHNLTRPDALEPFVMFATVGTLDLLITYPEDLQALAAVGHFLDLTTLAWDLPTTAFYNNYALYLHYFPLLDQHVIGDDELLIGIAVQSNNLDRIERLFTELLTND